VELIFASRKLPEGTAGNNLDAAAVQMDESFDEFQAAGYETASAYTLATTKKPCKFIYTDALWHGGDMIGLGVSSFSHFGGVHFQNAHSFEEYVALIDKNELPLLRALTLTPKQKLIREIILQLKTGSIELSYFQNKFGVNVLEEFKPVFEGQGANLLQMNARFPGRGSPLL
jgi:oxygen-independent coproporphyrinogen-3 oxidase